jgi:aspartate/methionine/tyrosine aminotransferase
VPVSTPLAEGKVFNPDKQAVISHITEKSHMIIVNSPNNLTGTVFSHTDLSGLAKATVERDMLVISDEVYEKITYDDARRYCLISFLGIRERTIIVGFF